MNDGELIEQLATAVSLCSEMLNGRDQMLDAIRHPEGPSHKSSLTLIVDDALATWREWRFGAGSFSSRAAKETP